MPAGLRVYRQDSEFIQIDQDFSNFGVRTKGVFAVNSQVPNWSSLYEGLLTMPGTTGVLAFRSNNPVYIAHVTYPGGNTQYRFTASSPTTVEYWYFDDPIHATLYDTANVGLLVFEADGSLGFDSRRKYLKVLEQISSDSNVSNRSYPASTVPAVIQGSYLGSEGLYPVPQDPNLYVGNTSGVGTSFNGSSLSFGAVSSVTGLQWLGPDMARSNSFGQSIYTIVDVAGM